MKKIISILIVVISAVNCMFFASSALSGGKCGENVTWSLDDGVLTISGEGEMYDYVWGNYVDADRRTPIYPVKDEIIRAVIEPGVESIGGSFFENCTNLTEVSIPDTVTVIKCAAFIGCSSLEAVVLPDSVKEISAEAFRSCIGLTEINLPEGLETIGEWAFQYCTALDSIKIPSTLKEISTGAFADGRLWHIEFSEGLEKIGPWAFKGCGDFDEVVLPDSLTEIGEFAFNGFSAEKILIPNTLKTIGKWAFFNFFAWFIYYKGTTEEFHDFVASVEKAGCATGNEDFIYYDVIIVGTRPNYPWGDQFLIKEEPTLDSRGVILYSSSYFKKTLEVETPKLADINDDGYASMKDVLMMRRTEAGLIELTNEQMAAADLNCDKAFSAKDILMLRKMIAGVD
ncbi:MAG: leucine-rich repeat protein [Clostridia bacterium]|nr:leucine-rich repeat protein [Clostridia bacterium]